MAQTVGDIMTRVVVQMPAETNLVDAARAMRDRQIGNVLVTDHGTLRGLTTDRDIVVRAVAEAKHPAHTRLAEIVSGDVVRIKEDATPAEAARVMRREAVRRLVVTNHAGGVTGILSLGDLAIANDPASALGVISGAPGNE
jgi:CBS domain-containing protein